MRIRGTGILSALIAVTIAAASCADIKRLVERPTNPVATPATAPESDLTLPVEPAALDDERNETPTVHFVKGTGKFIDPKAAALPTYEVTKDGTVILNFAGADIRDVVRSIMGVMLKLNYVLHPKVQGKVTIQTSRPLRRDALLPTLETVLRIHGAAIVRDADVYKVVPIGEAPSAGIRPSIDLPPAVRGLGFGIQIVPLEFISAAEMERILRPVAPAGGILRVDAARNLLLLAGTRHERINMLDVVGIFDVDWLAGMSVALIPLQAAEPKTVVEDLQQVFGNTGEGPLAGVIRFQPIERLNAILVITTRPDYLDRARTWIERLDGGVEGGERTLHVYLVQNGRAVDLADVLNQIFGDRRPVGERRRRGAEQDRRAGDGSGTDAAVQRRGRDAAVPRAGLAHRREGRDRREGRRCPSSRVPVRNPS